MPKYEVTIKYEVEVNKVPSDRAVIPVFLSNRILNAVCGGEGTKNVKETDFSFTEIKEPESGNVYSLTHEGDLSSENLGTLDPTIYPGVRKGSKGKLYYSAAWL